MKYFIAVFIILFFASVSFSQTKPKAKITTPAKKPVAGQPISTLSSLKTFEDSACYAIGINIAQSLKKDLKDLNSNALMDAMKNVFSNSAVKMDDATVMRLLTAYSEKAKENESGAVIKEGEDFLLANKTKTGIKTTASGLQYQIIKEGAGPKPTATDTIICNYKGNLINGTEFDNSYTRGQPLTIPIGSVIKGWTEGLQLMSKGATYKFFIPYQLGYGLRGAPPAIPSGSALVFEVELLDIKKGK